MCEKKCGFQGTRIINERLAGTECVIRKFGFHPVSEKKGEVLTEENGTIRSVFQRYHFTCGWRSGKQGLICGYI